MNEHTSPGSASDGVLVNTGSPGATESAVKATGKAEAAKPNTKLGLALSGGGFRASIFHIGVLKRLAELDLLREVSVISTVSGGSITGGHYLLHLKDRIEEKGKLTTADYVCIVRSMEEELRDGVGKNPRSRLFLDPLSNLLILCFADPPGERMASLYQRLIFARVTARLKKKRSVREARDGELPETRFRPGIRLRDMLIDPGAKRDIEEYNRRRGNDQAAETERIPKLILNASSLNSGRAFRFTAVEVGDDRLGFIRVDEALLVCQCKRLLARARTSIGVSNAHKEFCEEIESSADKTGRDAVKAQEAAVAWFLQTDALVWREDRRPETAAQYEPPVSFSRWNGKPPVADYLMGKNQGEKVKAACLVLSRKLMRAQFGLLRRAKLAAWYLLDGDWGWNKAPEQPHARGGYTREEHFARFWQSLELIDKDLTYLRPDDSEFARDPEAHKKALVDLLQFVLCLYYLRSARVFAWDIQQGLDDIRLVDAVASSANFPPVFTPYHIHDLYDASRVKYLSLTDGGIHDNTGVNTLLEEECTDVIVSDAGGVLRHRVSPAGDRLRMMGRIGEILTDYLWQMQRDKALDRAKMTRLVLDNAADREERTRAAITVSISKLQCDKAPDQEELRGILQANEIVRNDLEEFAIDGVVFFDMRSRPSDAIVDEPVDPHPYARLIADVRTDLDVFGSIEFDALVYQGYQLCDRFVRCHLRSAVKEDLMDNKPVACRPDDSKFAGKVLAASALRIGRLQAIFKTAWTLSCLAILTAIVFVLLKNPMSLREMVSTVWHQATTAVTGTETRIVSAVGVLEWIPRSRHAFLGWLVRDKGPCGLLIACLGLFILFSSRMDDALGHALAKRFGGRARAQRNRLRAARVLAPWRRNLLWGLWFAPIWVAAFGSVVSVGFVATGYLTKWVTSRRTQ